MSKDQPGLLRRVARGIGRAFRILVALVRGLLAIVFILVLLSLFGDGLTPLPSSAVLRVAPEGQLVERRSDPDPRDLLAPDTGPAAETRLGDLVDAIDAATGDPRIRGILLDLDDLQGGGIDKLDMLGEALQRFRSTGKPVIAAGDGFNQQQYYLASYADTIHLNPLGHVLLTGFGSYQLYYKEALDRLKIRFHVFRVGAYKDAVEPITGTGMSPAAREHTAAWLDRLWQHYRTGIEERRDLPAHALDGYIRELDTKLAAADGDGAALAIQEGLVDQLSTRPELIAQLRALAGTAPQGPFQGPATSYAQVEVGTYLRHQRADEHQDAELPQIGVLIAAGTMYDGESPSDAIGGDSLSRMIRNAREQGQLSALVVRVDSPGGSAFAADLIRRELLATQAAGIPVVISMGTVAASGGYWIAAEADEIWAEPTTLTGSIGVFGLLPTFEDSLAAVGIHSDGVGTHPLAGDFRLDRPLSPQAERLIQTGVEHLYDRFIALVAAGRGQDPQAIDRIAQGRVWTGRQAQELGLVDHLGGLPEAIAAAARLAGIDAYREVAVEPPLDLRQRLLRRLLESGRLPGTTIQLPEALVALVKLAEPLLQHPVGSWREATGRHLLLHCLECATP